MKEHLVAKNLVILESGSLREALVAISDNYHGAIVIVDENDAFLGVASDGDIRRAMVQGAILETPVSKVMNINPHVLVAPEIEQAKATFEKFPEITLFPIVDEDNKLVDVLTREGVTGVRVHSHKKI